MTARIDTISRKLECTPGATKLRARSIGFIQKLKSRSAFRSLIISSLLLLLGCGDPTPDAAPTADAKPPATQPQAIDATAEALAPLVRAGTPLLIEYNAAERLIHPYRLGANPKSGKLLLRAWEETKAGQPTNAFRTYEVAKITRAQTLPDRAPIDLPPQAYAPDKTIPSPIAERPRPQKQ